MKRFLFALLLILILFVHVAMADMIILPAALSVIEAEAFYGDQSIVQVVLPENIHSIGSKAFCKTGLEYIFLPDSLSYIAKDAFEEGVTVSANPGTYAFGWAIENGFIKVLDAPQIIMEDTFESGKDVTFSVVQDIDAEDYYLNLYWEDTQIYWDFHFWDPFSYTFYGYDLQPGNYTLTVTAAADGYLSSTTSKEFLITGNKHEAPLVSVDKTVVQENEEYTFTVRISGAEKILVREYFQGGYSNDIVNAESETMTFTFSDLVRKKSYQFCALIDGYWSELSEKITIRPKSEPGPSNGRLAAPQINMKNTFESGKDVTFSVVQDIEAEDYYLNLYWEDTQIYWDFHFWDPFSYTFYGYDLQPGNYTLTVTAAADGYQSNTTTKKFLITGNKHEAPLVSVDKTKVQGNEEYTFTVSISGANKILVREYFQGGYSEDIVNAESETMTFTFSDLVRKKSYQFCALIDGYWSEFSEKITIVPK